MGGLAGLLAFWNSIALISQLIKLKSESQEVSWMKKVLCCVIVRTCKSARNFALCCVAESISILQLEASIFGFQDEGTATN